MHHIDILDKEINIDGHLLRFPLSYEEVKAVLGEARIEEHRGGKSYVYDKEGMIFEEGSIEGFKKAKANLKSMRLLTTKLAALQKQCDPLGIVVIEV